MLQDAVRRLLLDTELQIRKLLGSGNKVGAPEIRGSDVVNQALTDPCLDVIAQGVALLERGWNPDAKLKALAFASPGRRRQLCSHRTHHFRQQVRVLSCLGWLEHVAHPHVIQFEAVDVVSL